jgi:hypothetical protein
MWSDRRSTPPYRECRTAAVVMISTPDGCAHAVREHIAAAAADGRFLTCCSRVVVSTSMVEQPGSPCPSCFPPNQERVPSSRLVRREVVPARRRRQLLDLLSVSIASGSRDRRVRRVLPPSPPVAIRTSGALGDSTPSPRADEICELHSVGWPGDTRTFKTN